MTAAKRMYLNLIKQPLPDAVAPPLRHNRHASYIQVIALRYRRNRTNDVLIHRRNPNRPFPHACFNFPVRKDGSIKPTCSVKRPILSKRPSQNRMNGSNIGHSSKPDSNLAHFPKSTPSAKR